MLGRAYRLGSPAGMYAQALSQPTLWSSAPMSDASLSRGCIRTDLANNQSSSASHSTIRIFPFPASMTTSACRSGLF